MAPRNTCEECFDTMWYWYACQLIHNICVQTCIGWCVRQMMYNICVIIYVSLFHPLSCDGPQIELSLLTSGLTPRVRTVRKDGTVNNTSIL